LHLLSNYFKYSAKKEIQIMMEIQIEDSWKEILKNEFEKTYFQHIVTFLKAEKASGKIIFPPGSLIFNSFKQTPFSKIKVVIIGQDPYHNKGQAHGLSFSVPDGIPKPPSLLNIFKELKNDLGIEISENGNLEKWASQGVLLLNASLTVRQNEPGSHAQIGWLQFTDEVIKKISNEKEGIIFLLWGKFAQEKQSLIDETKHSILKAAHPSPFSASNGFFGCKHFSKTNEILMKQQKNPIDWKI
jgi:uracil-DNA glycosylase